MDTRGEMIDPKKELEALSQTTKAQAVKFVWNQIIVEFSRVDTAVLTKWRQFEIECKTRSMALEQQRELSLMQVNTQAQIMVDSQKQQISFDKERFATMLQQLKEVQKRQQDRLGEMQEQQIRTPRQLAGAVPPQPGLVLGPQSAMLGVPTRNSLPLRMKAESWVPPAAGVPSPRLGSVKPQTTVWVPSALDSSVKSARPQAMNGIVPSLADSSPGTVQIATLSKVPTPRTTIVQTNGPVRLHSAPAVVING